MVRAQPSGKPVEPRQKQAGWRIHGVSVAGYRHRRSGAGCQDAWSLGDRGVPTVLAVADGAGSQPRSANGAQLAVNLATRHFGAELGSRHQRILAWRPGDDVTMVRNVLLATFQRLHEDFIARLEAWAVVDDSAITDYATTLTVVVLLPALLCQITVGDGFVLVRSGTERCSSDAEEVTERQLHRLPLPPAISEFGNETVFLTSSDVHSSVKVDCVDDPGIDGVLVSTDGFGPVILTGMGTRDGQVNHPLANRLLSQLDQGGDQEAVTRLLLSNEVARRNGDDMTLVRAVRA